MNERDRHLSEIAGQRQVTHLSGYAGNVGVVVKSVANKPMPQRPQTAKSPHAHMADMPSAVAPRNEIDRWYCNMPWRKCRASCLTFNPRCQAIVNGEQCTQAACIGHHLISPYKDRSLFLSWFNVVMVCAEHHPPGEGAGPDERYVTTYGMFGASCEPNETIFKLYPANPSLVMFPYPKPAI
jgi:hypothetical protein